MKSLLLWQPEKLRKNFLLAEAKESLEKRQVIQNKHANRHSTQLLNLKDKARLWSRPKMNEPWKQDTVYQVGLQPYIIIKEIDDNVYKRNRFYIRLDKSEIRPGKSVEDFYSISTDSASVPMQISNTTDNKSDKLQKVLPQGVVRRSSRTI